MNASVRVAPRVLKYGWIRCPAVDRVKYLDSHYSLHSFLYGDNKGQDV